MQFFIFFSSQVSPLLSSLPPVLAICQGLPIQGLLKYVLPTPSYTHLLLWLTWDFLDLVNYGFPHLVLCCSCKFIFENLSELVGLTKEKEICLLLCLS